jgi:branched-chain amino acid transport system permease protein
MTAAATSAADASAVIGQGSSAASGSKLDAARSRTFIDPKWTPLLVLIIAMLFPFIDSFLGLEMMNPMLRILTSVMLAIGLNIVVGYAGLLDLGYVAFWAIGAYVVGWFASGHFSTLNIHLMSNLPGTIPGIHISIWLLFIVGAVVTALFGVILGAPTLRLRGDYLAIVTLGFGEIVPKIFQNGDEIAGHNLTNGTRGISGLDTPSLGGAGVDSMLGMGWGTWGPLNLLPWYYLGLLLVCLCFYVSVQMQWSKLGRAWMAIREDELAASAMGINLVRTKLWAYGIGASLGGIAGVYHGTRIGSIFPASFQFYISISLLCMVIIGGMGNVWGAILGAFTIEGLNFWLLPKLSELSVALGFKVDLASWNLMIFGILLVVMMLYRPQGFLPAKARVIQFERDDGSMGPYEHPDSRIDHLHDAQPAGHGVEHYPSALQGPMATTHPVLEVRHEAHAPHDGGSTRGTHGSSDSDKAAGTSEVGSSHPEWKNPPRFPRFGGEHS